MAEGEAAADRPKDQPKEQPRRRSRFWLFAPYAVLLLLALGWSAAWVFTRNRVAEGLDAWFAAEAASGRQWRCPERSIGGYPFRIELVCPTLTLQHPGGSLSVGRTTVLAQAYDLTFVKAEVAGPLRLAEGDVVVQGTWRLAEASLRFNTAGLQRLALAADEPALKLTGPGFVDLPVSARRLEFHLRPNPSRGASEGAYDASLQATGAVLPLLDDLIGGREAVDLAADTVVTRLGEVTGRSLPEELERWRRAGGRVELGRLALTKGARRVEAAGEFGLDDLRRVRGTLQGSAKGLEGLLDAFAGNRGGLGGALLGALTGRGRQPPPAAEPGQGGLTPLPPVRLENGRLYLGPIAVPGVRFAPLY